MLTALNGEGGVVAPSGKFDLSGDGIMLVHLSDAVNPFKASKVIDCMLFPSSRS